MLFMAVRRTAVQAQGGGTDPARDIPPGGRCIRAAPGGERSGSASEQDAIGDRPRPLPDWPPMTTTTIDQLISLRHIFAPAGNVFGRCLPPTRPDKTNVISGNGLRHITFRSPEHDRFALVQHFAGDATGLHADV